MQFNKIKQYLLTGVCLKCGSFFCTDTLFCKTCYKNEIEERINNDGESHVGIDRHKYLIKWKKNESDVINQMVYRLKANNSLPAWSYYSRQFVKKININFKEYAGLVPIPGSKKESVHSWIFAKELSLLTGMPVLDILVKKNETTEQKKLSAYERANSQTIDLRSHQPELFTKCIFVDDVLTTGQSFFQSNRAVNGLNENIVLTLFYRGRGE